MTTFAEPAAAVKMITNPIPFDLGFVLFSSTVLPFLLTSIKPFKNHHHTNWWPTFQHPWPTSGHTGLSHFTMTCPARMKFSFLSGLSHVRVLIRYSMSLGNMQIHIVFFDPLYCVPYNPPSYIVLCMTRPHSVYCIVRYSPVSSCIAPCNPT